MPLGRAAGALAQLVIAASDVLAVGHPPAVFLMRVPTADVQVLTIRISAPLPPSFPSPPRPRLRLASGHDIGYYLVRDVSDYLQVLGDNITMIRLYTLRTANAKCADGAGAR